MIAEQWCNAYATQKTKRQTEFCNTKTPMISARKSDGNGMADKRVFSPSGLARNLATLRAAFLRNWVCFYAKTCRSLARAYARALVSKTTARLIAKLRK